jgi:hypothetical protein
MEFLSPLYLLAGAAAAVPLLIHLLRRRIGTRVEFPAVRYLARAEREHSRNLKLRNLLLMLLRVAAIVLIVAAAARPFVRVGGGGHAPTALAIALDNSLSSSAVVGGRMVLDELREQAEALLDRAGAADRVWIVTADGTVHGGGTDAVRAALARIEPLGGGGDMPAAAVRAAGLARGAPLQEREVVVLTDARATAWPGGVELGGVRVIAYRPASAPPRNRAVTGAEAVPSRWTPRGAVHARILAPDSVAYRMTLEGRTFARGTAVPGEQVIVHAAPAERGWTGGTVELEPDEMRGDDVRHFAVWLGPPPGVYVHPALGAFARAAIETLIESERAAPGRDVHVVPADEAQARPALLVAPVDPVRIGAANRALERLDIPWRFGSPRAGGVVSGGRLDGVTVNRRYQLTLRGGADVDTVATAGGEPWVVAGPGYVLLASPLVPEATDLPVRAAFVPFVAEMLSQRLTGGGGVILTAQPGEAISLPRDVTALEAPAGDRTSVTTPMRAPARAGVYFLLHGEQRAGALVVDPAPGESQLARLSTAELAERLIAREVYTTDDSVALMDRAFGASPRRSLVAMMLVGALFVLVAESLVALGARAREPRS